MRHRVDGERHSTVFGPRKSVFWASNHHLCLGAAGFVKGKGYLSDAAWPPTTSPIKYLVFAQGIRKLSIRVPCLWCLTTVWEDYS